MLREILMLHLQVKLDTGMEYSTFYLAFRIPIIIRACLYRTRFNFSRKL